MNPLKHLSAAVLTVLMLAFCFPTALAAPSMEVSGSAGVVITALSASHSTGADADITRQGDTQAVLEAELSCPGAWASFTLTVENRGDQAAVLSQVLQQDDTPEGIRISFGISNTDAGEILAAGETCTVTIVVQADPETTASVLEDSGCFSLALVYNAAGDIPKTGDRFPVLGLFLITAVSLAALLLLLRRRGNSF